ncbi:hypothetical protein OH782_41590 (plasmid) [Streptomyces sp. NBC_01544]|uniref:hypothetical protein n=1 Tax=Streptomyces TaxID=1883 RepID=UPI00224EAE0B|nr:hypothetical protein [Streptomyces sp. NBC_00154]MCX5318095.1 hypothetical protein [Streptomyces sp. NBC_00154]
MRVSLATLYARHSARLAARVAERLNETGADPIADVDDVTQDVWVLAAQLLAMPAQENAWAVLTSLLDQVLAAMESGPDREVPSGMELPAARGLPPKPMAALPSPAVELASAAAA